MKKVNLGKLYIYIIIFKNFRFFDRDAKRTSKSCENILKDIIFGNLLYN